MDSFHITSQTRLDALYMDYEPVITFYTENRARVQLACDDPEHAALLLVEAAQMLLEDNAKQKLRLEDMARQKARVEERKTA